MTHKNDQKQVDLKVIKLCKKKIYKVKTNTKKLTNTVEKEEL